MADCKIEDPDNCPAARGAAKSAVKEVFAILGVDVDKPEAVEEFRKSLRFGDDLRKTLGAGKLAIAGAVALLIFAVIVAGGKSMIAGIKIGLGAVP